MADAKIEKSDVQVIVKNCKNGDKYSVTKNEVFTGGSFKVTLRHELNLQTIPADISIDENWPRKKGKERVFCCYIGNPKNLVVGFSVQYPRGFRGVLPSVTGYNLDTYRFVRWSMQLKIM